MQTNIYNLGNSIGMSDFEKNVISLKKDIFFIFNNYLDFYLISRMLKDYSKNIMIFTGDMHSKNIINILSELGFIIKNEYRLKDAENNTILNNCVNLKNFNQPLFI
jgi:hypothetical protein